MKISSRMKICLSCIVATLIAGVANADEYTRKKNLTELSFQSASDKYDVMTRDRPEYAPKGVRMGSFVAYPSVDLGFISNDNIGAATTNQKEDIAVVVNPEFLLRSDFNLSLIPI